MVRAQIGLTPRLLTTSSCHEDLMVKLTSKLKELIEALEVAQSRTAFASSANSGRYCNISPDHRSGIRSKPVMTNRWPYIPLLMILEGWAFPSLASDCSANLCVPPPPQRETAAQVQQRQREIIAEELRILGPLANGVNPASCAAALKNARDGRRGDLEQDINIACINR